MPLVHAGDSCLLCVWPLSLVLLICAGESPEAHLLMVVVGVGMC